MADSSDIDPAGSADMVNSCAGTNSGNRSGVSNESKAAESSNQRRRDGGSVLNYTGTQYSFNSYGNGSMNFTGANLNCGEKSGSKCPVFHETVRTAARDQSPLKLKETNTQPVGVRQHSDIQEHPNAHDESCLENQCLVGDSSSDVVTQPARKRKHSSSIPMENPIEEYAITSKAKAKPSMDKANRSSAKCGDMSSSSITSATYTITECVRALNEIDGVPNETYIKAAEKFKEAEYREIFLNMPEHRKKAWLEKL